MGYSPKDVLQLISEKDVKFIDFRFTDTKGKEQHVSVPAHTIEEKTFVEGKMFDGS
ncbi:MAG: glutamine synthetase beta-grasp domain-containing protein, partial [Acidithiobacillus sp.]|nr:glutamine synthetase beta-grasp domain-containing protein [Acidithiobacillus sp.]